MAKPFFVRVFFVAACLLSSGCVHFSNSTAFKDPVVPLGLSTPQIRASVDEKVNFQPGVFLGWDSNEPPYDLNLSAHDESGDAVELVITELNVRPYGDDAWQSAASLPATATFEPWGNSMKDGRPAESFAKLEFPGLIHSNASFTLELKGFYLLRDGTKRTFESRGEFKSERDVSLLPIWIAYAGV